MIALFFLEEFYGDSDASGNRKIREFIFYCETFRSYKIVFQKNEQHLKKSMNAGHW